jgi:hypothetical protein
MSVEQWRAFLEEGTRTAKLATVRRDGGPHVVPIWFVLDGEDLILTTGRDSVKGRAIRRDGRAALCVDDEAPPFRFVAIEGTATASEDLDELRHYTTLIARRYMGPERAEAFAARNAVPGEMLVRIRPERVLAVDEVAG